MISTIFQVYWDLVEDGSEWSRWLWKDADVKREVIPQLVQLLWYLKPKYLFYRYKLIKIEPQGSSNKGFRIFLT